MWCVRNAPLRACHPVTLSPCHLVILLPGASEAGQAHVVALRAAADETLHVVQDMPAERLDAGHVGADLLPEPEEAVQLAIGVHRFADAVGKDRDKVSGSQRARVLRVLK